MRQLLCLAYIFLFFVTVNATAQQALPIAIDGQFDDWTSDAIELSDASNDDSGVDFLRFEASNDDDYLFLLLELADEVNLTSSNEITIYLDTDQNANTGDFINGIGAELTINIGSREAEYDLPSGNGFMELNDIGFRHLPSVTAKEFEIAIRRDALSNAGFPLFIENGMRIFWKDEDGPNGDQMPEDNIIFTYEFDDLTPGVPFEPIPLEKEGDELIRIVAWNTLQTGLDDIDRKEYFDRVMGVIQPDIVTFNECWDMNAQQVASFMNAASPLGNFQTWNTIKLDQGNVTASRWPILENWYFFDDHRLTASLIDLPNEEYATDLLVINAHFRCCEADFQRQREADAFIEFILDAKTPGGIIDLPENTPFILSGDLNLVGESQQLTTLLTGDIVNSGIFGQDGPPDWDDSDLLDVLSLQADQRMAHTWENPFSSFPPSRIDFHIISNSVLEVEKSYTLSTRAMTAERRTQYGLLFNDTRFASDHLPKVTDLRVAEALANEEVENLLDGLSISPNPLLDKGLLSFESKWAGEATIIIQSAHGQVTNNFSQSIFKGKNTVELNFDELSKGAYFLKIEMNDTVQSIGFLKK